MKTMIGYFTHLIMINDPVKVHNTLSNNLWHDTMAQENRFGINTGAEGEYKVLFQTLQIKKRLSL